MNEVMRRLGNRPFAIIGHRGAAGLAPENTIAGVLKAIDAGCDLVEIDIQVTLDGVVIALHDEDLRRVAGVDMNARRVRYRDLSGVTISGERIATLEEILSKVVDRIGVLIEVKTPGDETLALEVVKRVGAIDRVALISFHESVLNNAKRTVPTIPLGIVYAQPPGKIVEAKKSGYQLALPRYPLATVKAIELAHRLGLKVIAWTVNDEKWVRELASRGVDGIATDYPDMAYRVRKELLSTL